MDPIDRRRFLSSLGQTGALLAAGSWLDLIGYAQARGPGARVHPGRCARVPTSTGACWAPSSSIWAGRFTRASTSRARSSPTRRAFAPTSRARSRSLAFRSPAIRAATSSPATTGSTASGRRRSGRPCSSGRGTRLETNQFGTNDFIDWCRAVGTEPLLGMNFGTGTAEMAVAYVEYCNLDRGTKWSDLRRSHGYEQPHNVRYWCLGNEMDGNWQIGQLQAREYGRKARDVAKQMRIIDRGVQLIACGSSGTGMSTYMTWDREVLEECYDQVDGISLHAYYGNTQPLTGNSAAALPGDESRHGSADSRDRGRLRLRAGAAEVEQAPLAVVRRVERLVSSPLRERHERTTRVCAEAARGGLQPRGRAARRRLRQHAAAEFGSRPRRLPRAARQRHRAARHQRDRRAAPEHLLSVRVGASATRAAACSTCASRRRRIRSPAPVCRPTLPATSRCRSSTSSPRTTRRTVRRAC